jgi:hypothetical protein
MRGWDKDIVNTCAIDECAAKIQSSIIKAYEKSCPLKTASRGCRILLIGALNWEIGVRGHERLRIIVLLIPRHTKMRSKSTQKL